MATFDAAAAVAGLPGRFAARDLAGVARVLVRIDWPPGVVTTWGDSYVRLVRGTTAGDAAELIHLIAREVRGSGARRPAVLLTELSRLLPAEVLPDVCADWLAGADRSSDAVAWDGEVARVVEACLASGAQLAPVLVAAIRRMPDYPFWSGRGILAELAGAFPGPVLNPGEAWSDAALADADAGGPPWLDLVGHAVTASSSKPSARWEQTARGLLATVGEQTAAKRIGAWLALVGRPRTIPLVGRGRGADELFDPGNVDGMRGLAWMLGFVAADAESARSLASLVEAALRRLPGLGPRSPKVANAAVYGLSRMPGEAALAQLGRLAASITYRGTLAQVERALAEQAAELGVSREQIEELAVPDFGLTAAGRRVERFGGVRAELAVRGPAVDLTWRTEAGRVVKSAPAQVRREFAPGIKDLKTEVADIEQMLTAQAQRLERLFLARRSWEFARWTDYYLDHPLVGTLARRLIWIVDGVAVGYADGGLRTVTDAALAPGPAARVELWHPIGRETAEISAWRDWLGRHQVTQPFKQAHREVYALTIAESTGTYSNRFAGHTLRQHQLHALATQRGWHSQLRFMAENAGPPTIRPLPQWDLRAEFQISGIGQDPELDGTDQGAFRSVTTGQVRFGPAAAPVPGAPAPEPTPLADVPPLVVSEVFRDVDLFVGVAGLGRTGPAGPVS